LLPSLVCSGLVPRSLCAKTLRTVPKPQWIEAWEFRRQNSTIRRRNAVEALFAQHVPYFRLDNAIAVAFINEVEALVQEAMAAAKDTSARACRGLRPRRRP
jgi:hypothetical protein